jgi:hypothetical protein
MATTTPINGWPVPTSTDLVTNGASAIESLGDAIDTAVGAGLQVWTSYTPVWGSNGTAPSLGNGTYSAAYAQIGKIVHYRIQMTLGSTSTVGTGSRYSWTLPVTGTAVGMGQTLYFDSSTNLYYPAMHRISTTTADAHWYTMGSVSLTSGALSASSPVVPANGDTYYIRGTYEAA